MPKKPPSVSTPAYVCARLRRAFRAKGWPLHVMRGRYSPYFNQQSGTEGYVIKKVGCSKGVTIHYCGAYRNGSSMDVQREVRQARETEAWALVEKLGYTISNPHGLRTIQCEFYDE